MPLRNNSCSFGHKLNLGIVGNVFKKAYRKSWTLDACSGRIDFGWLYSWILNAWLWIPGHLDSGQSDTWTRNNWTLLAWNLDDWTLRLWTLGLGKFFPFFVKSVSFFLLFNVEFINVSNVLQVMYYGSVESAANGFYNSNLYNLCYNSDSLARQQLGLKRNIWGPQIIG